MTEKMKFETKDLIQENIAKIGQLFPEVLTEAKDDNGILKKAIDFDKLRQILSTSAISNRETYDFTWVGKKQAILEAATPIRKTLRPCKEESVNWDTTQNLYIEGDNLDVLKLLQDCYVNQVKMIYIDPPYNTGKDFIYKDDFAVSQKEYNESDGRVDECGNRLVKNTDSNGRFHSDWCSMMYPRLKLARNLLADDGVIFISMDEHEIDNLKKICDEVFGSNNFIYQLSVVNKLNGNDNSSGMMETQEFCLIYSRSKQQFQIGVLPLEEDDRSEWKKDEIGYWKEGGAIKATGVASKREDRPNLYYPLYIDEKTLAFSLERTANCTYELWPIIDGEDGRWTWQKEKFIKDANEVIIKRVKDGYSVYKKQRPQLGDLPSKRGKTTFYHPSYSTANSSAEIKTLFDGKKIFEFSKSSNLIKDLLSLGSSTNNFSIILDFFSGSATTAHAVMKLNAEDGGNRKFIMVQIPEPCDEKSEAYKAGYKNICEIGKERIRRAAKQIKGEHPESNFDSGFRVFKLADSNMKDVYFSPSEYKQDLLSQMTSNIKEDRTDMDLLYGCMLEWKLPLSFPHTSEKVGSYTIHNVNNGALMACFDENIPEDIIRHMAAKKPRGVVFRDAGFADSPAKINVGELFKLLSPDTKVKVI
ncbi:site-specific DNA-methyltransferase [Candidatus Avelusimicrobium fimicolum]|uniref:site-specific DNA-methyltransferase n=1 Tax=Candidatus Avelusimicrobium fimicolum TaxID=3416216 RepID=UPI003D1339F9